jgi:hypothetical protein
MNLQTSEGRRSEFSKRTKVEGEEEVSIVNEEQKRKEKRK